VLIELSDAAGAAADRSLGAYHRAVTRIVADMSPAERRAVGRFLDELVAAAELGVRTTGGASRSGR
jgi:hypothetical protein